MSKQNSILIVWDADGVLIDSREVAWKCAEQILSLFGLSISITNQEEYRKCLGVNQASPWFSEAECATLRELHRMLMKRSGKLVRVVEDVAEMAGRLAEPSVVVTSAYASYVHEALAERGKFFNRISGKEEGKKSEILQKLVEEGYRMILGITDTTTDVKRYQKLGIKPILVTWGYETANDARDGNPGVVCVSNVSALESTIREILG